MLDFYVGQKVVCVDADLFDVDGSRPLREGAIYTIAEIGPDLRRPDIVAAQLVGVRRARDWYEVEFGCPRGFFITRFRPLIETEISVFQAMLAPKPVKQRENQDA